jgi:hypothetical protein
MEKKYVAVPKAPINSGGSCRGILHVVKKGDTLYKLGKQYNINVSAIMYANPYVNVYNLQVGDELCIPVGSQQSNNGEANGSTVNVNIGTNKGESQLGTPTQYNNGTGKMTGGRMDTGQTMGNRTGNGQMSEGQMNHGQMPGGQMSHGQMPAGHSTPRQMPGSQMGSGQMSTTPQTKPRPSTGSQMGSGQMSTTPRTEPRPSTGSQMGSGQKATAPRTEPRPSAGGQMGSGQKATAPRTEPCPSAGGQMGSGQMTGGRVPIQPVPGSQMGSNQSTKNQNAKNGMESGQQNNHQRMGNINERQQNVDDSYITREINHGKHFFEQMDYDFRIKIVQPDIDQADNMQEEKMNQVGTRNYSSDHNNQMQYNRQTGQTRAGQNDSQMQYNRQTGQARAGQSDNQMQYNRQTGQARAGQSDNQMQYNRQTGQARPGRSDNQMQYDRQTGQARMGRVEEFEWINDEPTNEMVIRREPPYNNPVRGNREESERMQNNSRGNDWKRSDQMDHRWSERNPVQTRRDTAADICQPIYQRGEISEFDEDWMDDYTDNYMGQQWEEEMKVPMKPYRSCYNDENEMSEQRYDSCNPCR